MDYHPYFILKFKITQFYHYLSYTNAAHCKLSQFASTISSYLRPDAHQGNARYLQKQHRQEHLPRQPTTFSKRPYKKGSCTRDGAMCGSCTAVNGHVCKYGDLLSTAVVQGTRDNTPWCAAGLTTGGEWHKSCLIESSHPFSCIHVSSTYQLNPCLFEGVYFSRRAVNFKSENFCSKLIWVTDWQFICSDADLKLGRCELWKLCHLNRCLQRIKTSVGEWRS